MGNRLLDKGYLSYKRLGYAWPAYAVFRYGVQVGVVESRDDHWHARIDGHQGNWARTRVAAVLAALAKSRAKVHEVPAPVADSALEEVVVGNIGTVYSGHDAIEAHRKYLAYKEMSERNYGRAAGEAVTWLRGGELYAEHFGVSEEDA